uniref:ANAPC4_WD40 domain-containing protein n=1 Tax=Parastrongyloides trichosuri TaxID=131310 RepID=A0A0N4Z194_PARTI
MQHTIYPELIKNNKIFEALPKVSLINWITTSSKNGLIFATSGNNSVVTLQSSDIHRREENIKKKTTTLFNVDYNILRLCCSCTGDYLAIILKKSNEHFIYIYDSKTFSFEFTGSPFPIYRENVGENILLDFQWNPVIEGMFVYTHNEQRLYCMEFVQGSSSFSNKRIEKLRSNGNCISWSPKGKQLVVGCSDGSMYQYKPELTLVRKENPPVINDESEVECIGICWLGTTDFVFAFEGKTSKNITVSLLVLKKNQPANWTHLGDITKIISRSVEPTRFNFENIVDWGIVLVSSNNGICAGILEKNTDFYKYVEPPENKEIILELSESGDVPILCGLILDKSATIKHKDIVDGVTIEHKLSPAICILNSNGIIQSYWLITRNDKHKDINVPYEGIILSKIQNGRAEDVPQNKPADVTFGSPSLFGSQNTSTSINTAFVTKITTPVKEQKISLGSVSLENNEAIKLEALKKEIEIKEKLQKKEKEVIKKVKEEVKRISEAEKSKKESDEEVELSKLRKVCGELITEYYSRKNINMVKIQAQENAIKDVNQKFSITNDENVNELLKTLNLMTISQNRVSHWAQIVSEDVQRLSDTLKILKDKIAFMKKNGTTVAETYYFDTKSRYDESEEKLIKIKENFIKLTDALQKLEKMIEKKGLKNNIDQLDNTENIEPHEQEDIRNVSRNILRATYVAFRKLKIISDKQAELKKIIEKGDSNDKNTSYLNQSVNLNTSFILDKTFFNEVEYLPDLHENKYKNYKLWLKKKCEKPVEEKIVNILPFSQNIEKEIQPVEEELETSVSDMKEMLEKCLVVSKTMNDFFVNVQNPSVYLTENDITSIRKIVVDEAKEYSADFKATLEMTRKLMAAEMPKINLEPPKENVVQSKEPVNKIEEKIETVNKTTNTDLSLLKELIVEEKEEDLNSKKITIGTLDKQVESKTSVLNASTSSEIENNKTTLTNTVTETPLTSIFGGNSLSPDNFKSSPYLGSNDTLKSSIFGGSNEPPKSLFDNKTSTETPKSSFFGGSTSSGEKTKVFSFEEKTETPKTSFFGGMSITKPNETPLNSFFGASTKTQQQTSFFGGSSSTQKTNEVSVFGGDSNKNQQNNVFGQSAFGGSQPKSVFGQSTFGGSFGGSSAFKNTISEEGMDDGNGYTEGFSSGINITGSQQSENKSIFAQSAFGASTNSSQGTFSFAKPTQGTNTFQQSSVEPKPGFFSGGGGSVFGGSGTKTVFGKPAFGGGSSGTFGSPSNTSTFNKPVFGQGTFSSFSSGTNTSFGSIAPNTQQSPLSTQNTSHKGASFTQWR